MFCLSEHINYIEGNKRGRRKAKKALILSKKERK